ncbi:unnamed protein product [Symbiodinium sp. CCMP2592]|nr:unnamed protein product [Symbiodinium sp. CCMP2592]
MCDAMDPTEAGAGENFLDMERDELEQLLATFVSRLQPVSTKSVRAVRTHEALRWFAQALRAPTGVMAEKSFETTEIDEFWSHSWHGRKWNKALTAMYLKNGMLATAVATFMSVVLAFIVGAGLLPPRFQEEPIYPFSSWWCSVAGSLLFCLVLVFWRPWQKIFVDVLCINQGSEDEKSQAILSMGAILKCSEKPPAVQPDETYPLCIPRRSATVDIICIADATLFAGLGAFRPPTCSAHDMIVADVTCVHASMVEAV